MKNNDSAKMDLDKKMHERPAVPVRIATKKTVSKTHITIIEVLVGIAAVAGIFALVSSKK